MPGVGVDFAAVADVLLLVLAVYVVSSGFAWCQGYLLNDVVQGTVFRLRSEVEDKIHRLPLRFFDKQPRGELLSRVTNDIDNISQTLQQTTSQLLTERQLITIAQAFLADPALLILDEATSSVDTRTELLVQHAMAALRSDRTSFVIAHRLSTIRDADQILVMESGRIVEQGHHAELLAREGAYASLYNAQFAAPAAV